MKLEVIHEVTCSAAPEAVWDYVATNYFANHATWDPAIAAMEQSGTGPVRPGVEGVETRRFLGRQRARFLVTEYVAPKRFALRNTSGPFNLERAYEFTSDGGGTRVRFAFRMAPKGPAKLLFPLVRGTIARQVRANIDRLATVAHR